MNIGAIKRAIGQRLTETPNIPAIVWPNRDAGQPSWPYIVVDYVPTGRTTPTLAGTVITDSGYAMITVVSELDAFETDADTWAQTIADRFQMGLRLTIEGERVLIIKPSEIKQGYRDGVYWRTPVKVFYQTD